MNNRSSAQQTEEHERLLHDKDDAISHDVEVEVETEHTIALRTKDDAIKDHSPHNGEDSTYGSLDLDTRLQTSQDLPLHLDAEALPAQTPAVVEPKKSRENVRWRDLPRKDQLFILVLARLAEPLAATSMTSYIYFMLSSFDESLSDADVAQQVGLLAGAFALAQCLTAVWWGRLADKEWMGRKNVLLIGLSGTAIATLGIAFSKSFMSLMFFRCLGGMLNGNVGVMRTMISEIVKEKRYQPKAFLVLPVTFNLGVLIGPVLGGWLQSPVPTFPGLFGKNSVFGGADGVQWMLKYPYALPNLVFFNVFVFSICLVKFGLEETHMERRHLPDRGLQIGRTFARFMMNKFWRRDTTQYQEIDHATDIELDTQHQHQRNISLISNTSTTPKRRQKLPYRRIFTPNVCFTFLAAALTHIHVATFQTFWYLFLSTPRAPLDQQHLPLSFSGGLGLPPSTVGFAIGIIGVIGLSLQFGVYSRVIARLGVVNTFRLFTAITFPVVYLAAPYLAVVPTTSAPPAPANGPAVWLAIASLLFVQVLGRTFVLPITQILVNNCTPHPSALASVHGLASSITSGARTLGPVVWTSLYAVGLERGIVWLAWWTLAAEAALAAGAGWLLREGTGHEIWLEGDDDEM